MVRPQAREQTKQERLQDNETSPPFPSGDCTTATVHIRSSRVLRHPITSPSSLAHLSPNPTTSSPNLFCQNPPVLLLVSHAVLLVSSNRLRGLNKSHHNVSISSLSLLLLLFPHHSTPFRLPLLSPPLPDSFKRPRGGHQLNAQMWVGCKNLGVRVLMILRRPVHKFF